MFKWDFISWIALGIFIAGLGLAAVFQNDTFLLMLVGAYILRPALIAFGYRKAQSDERQTQVQFHSGNIAFIVVVIAIILMALYELMNERPADNYFLLLCIALATKAIIGLFMIGDYRKTALRFSFFIGLMYVLFVGASHGISLDSLIEGSPGILILIAGWLGIKWPRISAGIFIALGIATLVMFGIPGGFTLSRIGVSLLLSAPLLITAFCFFKSSQPTEPQETVAS